MSKDADRLLTAYHDGYFDAAKALDIADEPKIDQIDKSGEPTKLLKYYDGPLTDKCSCCWSDNKEEKND